MHSLQSIGNFVNHGILNKKLSDLSRNLRTKINEILLETNTLWKFLITNENDVVMLR